MAQHVVIFYASVLTSGILAAIPPVADPTVTIGSNNLYVPDKYNRVLYAGGLTGAVAATRQQLRAPSLREFIFPEITPATIAGAASGGNFYKNYSQNFLQLDTNEGLNYYSDGGGDGTTAQGVYGVVILGDASPADQKGKIFSLYATTSIAAAPGSWANGIISLDQTLPVGNYDVVGLRVNASGGIAARLIFIGPSAITRPGVFISASAGTGTDNQFQGGNNGIYGTFNTTTPPSLEIIGGTSTTQSMILDLIKRS